jgi:hypothetical protein
MAPAEIIQMPSAAAAERAEWLSLIDKMPPASLELLLLIARGLTATDSIGPMPDGPDAEMIRLCGQLCVIHAAIDATYQATPDEVAQNGVLGLLNARWFETADEVRKLEAPRTPEGARAAATALLNQYPGGVGEASDLATWLSIRCAEYLAGTRTD